LAVRARFGVVLNLPGDNENAAATWLLFMLFKKGPFAPWDD
jgi:hypothetical protein